MINKIKLLLRRLRALLPQRLPQGMAEFETWSNDILEIYEVPNNDSFKFSLAVMMLHLGPQAAYKPKHYFGLSLYKAMAAEVAAQVMQDLKAKQQAEMSKPPATVVESTVVTNGQSS